MKPTDEQGLVLNATGRVIQINARAGTGKTTTLLMLSKKNHNKRILYLVYNRKTSEEARNKFPPNVKVSTVHALAFKREGYKWKDNIGNFTPADILPAFGEEGQILAQISHSFLTYFLNTPFDKFEDAVPDFHESLPKQQGDLFEKHTAQILEECKKMVTRWHSMETPCPHDFYLKMFHRTKGFYAELAQYDIIMVDEGQDLSPIMVDALKHCKKRIIIVGDSHQQIYSFRYAIDAMTRLSYDNAVDLTSSFRFGESIAAIATAFIQEAKKHQTFSIQGNPQKVSSVSLYNIISDNGQKTAILTRTNVALFENAMALKEGNNKFYFEKDLSSLFWRALDVYWLSKMQQTRIRDPFIKTFRTYANLKLYIEMTDDFQLQGLCQIVDKYTKEFPSLIYEMLKFSNDNNSLKEGIVLSTIHSAKGQEYERVYIDADVAERLKRVTEKKENSDDPYKNQDLKAFIEEVNITYVAFTRAKEELFLPTNFKTVLTDQWKDLLYSLPPVSKTKDDINESRNISHEKRKQYQVGDRVALVFDSGTIIEISGEKCLIDLDSQSAQVWENFSNIRRLKRCI